MKLVKVDWEDTLGDIGWKNSKDVAMLHPWLCSTVGWLVHKDTKRIIVCSSLSKDGELWNDHNSIPKGCITKITPLREE